MILTLLIVSSLSILPCFAQSAASIELKKPEWYKTDKLVLTAAVFSPDLQTIAGMSGTVIFWDVSTGEVIRSLRDVANSPMAFSPDGHILVVGGHENRVLVWNASKGETFYHDEIGKSTYQINSIAFSPDGRTVANGCQRNPEGVGFVRLWDVSTGKTIRMFEHPGGAVRSVTFSPDGRTLASMVGGGAIHLWDVLKGEIVRTIKYPIEPGGLFFSPDGGTLANVGGAIRLWDVLTGENVGEIYGENLHITNVAFRPCGGTIANVQSYVPSSHTIMRVWDVSTGERIRTLDERRPASKASGIITIAFSPNGGTLASVNNDGTVLLWDMAPCAPERLPEDVNGDGVVDIRDLVEVAAALGETGDTPADVNGDGIVNIQDLVQVAGQIGAGAAAP